MSSTPLLTAPDIASERLRIIRVRGVFYAKAVYHAPWGVTHGAGEGPMFHIVIEGSCLLSVDGHPAIRLSAGDVAVLPRGCAHKLQSSAGVPAPALESIASAVGFNDRVLSYGGGGEATTLLCGWLSIEGGTFARDTLASIPDVVQIMKRGEQHDPATSALIAAIVHEVESFTPGQMEVVCRLCDLLFAQALRPHLEKPLWKSDQSQPITAALRLMHQYPGRDLSLRDLAESGGISRAVLCKRFREMTGLSPMQYLAHYRLLKAAALLETTDLSLKEIAELTGYEGNVSLSKAFRRRMGDSPGGYRRRIRTAPTGRSSSAANTPVQHRMQS